ncbi:hypothetical protein MKEN_00170800 [Mycena kentingensis (nom. inval.)]|nr:hypothetical protein MKEN_00170800 [Mycena kentingensis (nom. inval.)]
MAAFAPPTPPPDSAALPTSVSSPAWFPSVASPLVPSSSTATLVGDATSPAFVKPKSTLESSALVVFPAVHELELEEGEITELGEVLSAMRVDDEAGERPLPPLPESPASSLASSASSCVSEIHIVSSRPSPKRGQSGETAPTPTKPVVTISPSTPSYSPSKPAPTFTSRTHESTERLARTKADEVTPAPNVYINGLPPNYPEDQLFALAAPFGTVKSVRTFTRHVGDAETGYGFVLFEDIAAAERCIEKLRQYRNLHPTFAKQAHKIPGTIYAHPRPAPASTSESSGNASSVHGWEQEGSLSGDSTFKEKMERLSDKRSTNLYIEGLPLTIDEATLAALVSPYSIRSSRFFQTRLSNPPRIIAFVRLETRAAAEEIVERLHGRKVRGWNDPEGARISVRFADTAEQRELRRQERQARDGEAGVASGQLSIAQATLLTLRGKELGGGPKSNSGYRPTVGGRAYADVNGYSSSRAPHHDQYSHQQEHEVDYPRSPPRFSAHPSQPRYIDPESQSQQSMHPAMASLLQSLEAQAHRQSRGLGLSTASSTQATLGGYTPAEELILRGGAQPKRRPHPLDVEAANIGMGVRGYRTQAATFSLCEPQMNEEDFHAHSLPAHNNNNSTRISRNSHTTQQQQHLHPQRAGPQSFSNQHYAHGRPAPNHMYNSTNAFRPSNNTHMYASGPQHAMYSHPTEHSPSLVSPALTFSSRSSASGYSPTTPYFQFDVLEDETQAIGKKMGNVRTAAR